MSWYPIVQYYIVYFTLLKGILSVLTANKWLLFEMAVMILAVAQSIHIWKHYSVPYNMGSKQSSFLSLKSKSNHCLLRNSLFHLFRNIFILLFIFLVFLIKYNYIISPFPHFPLTPTLSPLSNSWPPFPYLLLLHIHASKYMNITHWIILLLLTFLYIRANHWCWITISS